MTTEKLTGRIEALHSRRDRFGNCYWALRYTDYGTGRTVVGTVSGGESNINAIRQHLTDVDGWDSSIESMTVEMPIREFNQLTKNWAHAGCRPVDLADFIRRELDA